MKRFLKKMFSRLPWNRPRLSDLPPDERRRVKAMMLCAVAGAAVKSDADGAIRVTHIKADEESEESEGRKKP